jgi:hypothetical protein
MTGVAARDGLIYEAMDKEKRGGARRGVNIYERDREIVG